MPKDVIITPASGKLDFYGTTGGPVLANINLTDNNDLSLSTTSGNLIIGDASRDVYIGDGTNEVDIVFEQNGEIRSVAGKYITVNAGTVTATGVAVNTSSPTAVMHVYGSTPSGTVFNVEGANGSLFSVVDNLNGSLMSVNNNAGLPVFEVFSDDRIVGGRFGQNDWVITSGGNVGIGTSSPSGKLHVVGDARIGNSQYIDVNNGNVFIKNPDGSLVADFEEKALFGDSNIKSIEFGGNRSLVDSVGASTLYWNTPSRIGILNHAPSYTLDVNGSGNFASGLAIANQTTNTIASFDSNKNVTSLSTTTYPTLTELSYVKGVTSAIQTQLGNKANTNQTMFIGTTSVAINRASASQTLTGVNIDGNAGTVTSGVYTAGAQTIAGIKTFSSQIISTAAGSSAVNGGQIYLNGSSNNRIDFNSNGVSAPTSSFTPNSIGNKIVLSPFTFGSSSSIGIGVAGDSAGGGGSATTLWNQVGNTNHRFEWYGGVTKVATLTGSGVLTVEGSSSQVNVDNLRLDGNTLSSTSGNLIINSSGNTSIFIGTNPEASYGGIDMGYKTTIESLYVPVSFGFGEADTPGNGIRMYNIGLNVLEVNNGGGNQGSVFKAIQDIGVDTQGVFTLCPLGAYSQPLSKKITETTIGSTTSSDAQAFYWTQSTSPSRSSRTFTIKISAYNHTDSSAAGWVFRGVVKRNNSNQTSFVGSVIEENWKDTAMNNAMANLSINGNDLQINFSGILNKTIDWTAEIDILQARHESS